MSKKLMKGTVIPIEELREKFIKRLTINFIVLCWLCLLLFLFYAVLYKNWKLDFLKVSNTFCQIIGILLLFLDERYKTENKKSIGKRLYKYLTWEYYYYQSSTLRKDWNSIRGARKRKNVKDNQECQIEVEISATTLDKIEVMQSNIEQLSNFSKIRSIAYVLLGIGLSIQLIINIIEWYRLN